MKRILGHVDTVLVLNVTFELFALIAIFPCYPRVKCYATEQNGIKIHIPLQQNETLCLGSSVNNKRGDVYYLPKNMHR